MCITNIICVSTPLAIAVYFIIRMLLKQNDYKYIENSRLKISKKNKHDYKFRYSVYSIVYSIKKGSHNLLL